MASLFCRSHMTAHELCPVVKQRDSASTKPACLDLSLTREATIYKLKCHPQSCPLLGWRFVLCRCLTELARDSQVISDLRAKLSNAFYPANVLNNDDQGILTRDGNSVILVPSNGYTFERTPTQVTATHISTRSCRVLVGCKGFATRLSA